MKTFVMIRPEPVTLQALKAATRKSPELLQMHEERQGRSAVLIVQCKRVEATEYGLVRLVLEQSAQPLSVAVQPALIISILEKSGKLPVGFLSD